MLDREPFLKAIYAEPDSDLPRLVFADWLDDHGDHAWAELIRIQCELSRPTAAGGQGAQPQYDRLMSRLTELVSVVMDSVRLGDYGRFDRGMWDHGGIYTTAERLSHPDRFRTEACARSPDWYGAKRLVIVDGVVAGAEQMETLLTSPVTEHVTSLNLSGQEEQLGATHDEALGIGLIDFRHKPVVATRMVEMLCDRREARRLVTLDLTNNDLDNDAVRALVRSKHLIRLRELNVMDGNTRVRGSLWGELQRRYGPEVVR